MRESVIEKYLVKEVKARGGEVRKVKWIGHRGAPDRLVMLPGASCWVELKATGVKAEAYQIREHNLMRKLGENVYVIDSFEGVDALLHPVVNFEEVLA